MKGAEMIEQLRAQGYTGTADLGEIDEVAVEQFVAGAKDATPAQIEQIANRMYAMVGRHEMARGANLPTMAAVADRLMGLLA